MIEIKLESKKRYQERKQNCNVIKNEFKFKILICQFNVVRDDLNVADINEYNRHNKNKGTNPL